MSEVNRSYEAGIWGPSGARWGEEFGQITENRAAGAQFWRTHSGGARSWMVESYLGRGKPKLKGREVWIDRHARGGGLVEATYPTQAAGAQLCLTKGGEALIWVVGTYVGWLNPKLRGWGAQ
jgi:hypothetical protein